MGPLTDHWTAYAAEGTPCNCHCAKMANEAHLEKWVKCPAGSSAWLSFSSGISSRLEAQLQVARYCYRPLLSVERSLTFELSREN